MSEDHFHAHLDSCSQCRNNPMALCFMGAVLLKAAAEGGRWVTSNAWRIEPMSKDPDDE